MPSRFGVVMIIVFWFGVTGHVIHRDVWPRFFSDSPPPVHIDLVDEAAQTIPVRWVIYRGSEQFGTLTSRMEYFQDDDTFRFNNNFSKLTIEVGAGLAIEVTRMETGTRVSRPGELREQTMNLEARLVSKGFGVSNEKEPTNLFQGSAKISGKVENGLLKGDCVITINNSFTLSRELDPVAVPAGQVLNPMNPVSRLNNVRPGRRWVIRQSDPMFESLQAIFQQSAENSSKLMSSVFAANKAPQDLIAEVEDEEVMLERHILTPGEQTPKFSPTPCWQITYRNADKVFAKTYVSVLDGRILCQEASLAGDPLRFERDE